MADITIKTATPAKVKVSAGTTESSKNTNFSNVRLNIIGSELYIVAPAGLLNTDTDKPVFARYVKSSVLYYVNGKSKHDKRIGWIRPTKAISGGGGKTKELVPMRMEYVSRWDSDTYDYFKVFTAAQNYETDPLDDSLYSDAVAEDLYNAQYNAQAEFQYTNKKLGVCIERDGKQITDYLHFSIDVQKGGPYLSRWSIGIITRTVVQ